MPSVQCCRICNLLTSSKWRGPLPEARPHMWLPLKQSLPELSIQKLQGGRHGDDRKGIWNLEPRLDLALPPLSLGVFCQSFLN